MPFFCYLQIMITGARLSQFLLKSAEDTANQMARLSVLYANDLGDKINWPLQKFYDFVKNLEFRSDPRGHESIARPRLTLQENWPWRDCDDKSILIGAWLFANKIPFKFEANSKAPSGHLHHVYVKASINGKPFFIDATYPKNRLGFLDKGITKTQTLTGEIMQSTLNIFEGDNQPLGWSLRKIGRKIGRNKFAIASAAGGPAGILAYQAFKRRKAIKNKVLNGSYDYPSPELMGASFLKRMSRKAKKVGKVVLKTPGLKDSLASMVPGGSAMLAQARAINKKIRVAKNAIPKNESISMTAPMDPIPMAPEGMSNQKKMLIGGGVLAVGLVAVLALRKKR